MEIQRGMRGYHKSRTFHKTTLIFELVPWNLWFFDFSTFRILLPLFDFSDFSTFAATFRLFGLFDFSSFAATFRLLLPLFDFSDFSTFRVLLRLFDFLTFRLFEFFSIVLTLDPECIRVVPQNTWHYTAMIHWSIMLLKFLRVARKEPAQLNENISGLQRFSILDESI